jgi:hypothetical protein
MEKISRDGKRLQRLTIDLTLSPGVTLTNEAAIKLLQRSLSLNTRVLRGVTSRLEVFSFLPDKKNLDPVYMVCLDVPE